MVSWDSINTNFSENKPRKNILFLPPTQLSFCLILSHCLCQFFCLVGLEILKHLQDRIWLLINISILFYMNKIEVTRAWNENVENKEKNSNWLV